MRSLAYTTYLSILYVCILHYLWYSLVMILVIIFCLNLIHLILFEVYRYN